MTYQALYRVWRPQTFDELVGQTMIAQTLKNAISHDQMSHAYLFAGPRGTGKTSAAKILAKAVNCPNAVDGNPCNECEVCQAITRGQVSDVIEIDAASNNGVDEIRDLRDKVRYAPTVVKNKVYIIDEVHMLTTGAFNALLKTLEEPPSHVLFVLATTEPHKIPATILSRTQRFDFQRIKDTDLIAHMSEILKFENRSYDDEALALIARCAKGGMRDALSLLDQALSFSQERLDLETALSVTGSFSQQLYCQYIEAVFAKESGQALAILDKALSQGKQANRFIEDLILFVRDLLLSQFTQVNYSLLNDQELATMNQKIPADFYHYLIAGLNQALDQMRFSSQAEVYVEVMTLRLSRSDWRQDSMAQSVSHPIQEESSELAQMEEKLAGLQAQVQSQQKLIDQLLQQERVPRKSEPLPTQQEEKSVRLHPRQRPGFAQEAYQLDLNAIYQVLNQATLVDIQAVKKNWPNLLEALPPLERVKLVNSQPLAAGPDHLLVALGQAGQVHLVQADEHLLSLLQYELTQLLNKTIQLVWIAKDDWQGVRADYKLLFDRNGGQPVQLNVAEGQSARVLEEDEEEPMASANNSLFSIESDTDSDSANLEEISQEDPLVDKALELFGQDHVRVYPDR